MFACLFKQGWKSSNKVENLKVDCQIAKKKCHQESNPNIPRVVKDSLNISKLAKDEQTSNEHVCICYQIIAR